MKSLKILLAVAIMGVAGIQQSQAQDDDLPSAESIIKNYVEKTGGIDKYKAVKNVFSSGTLSVPQQNISGTMEMTVQMPGKLSADVEIEGIGSIVQGSNGEHTWEISVIAGPRLVEGDEAEMLTEETSMDKLVDPANFYKSMETTGVEDVDGEKCYRLVLTKKNDKKVEAYYSVESGLEVKRATDLSTQMGDVGVEIYFSDYRDVDGILTPFKTEQKMSTGVSVVISFDKMQYNVDVDAKKFDIPDEIQKLIDKKADKEKADKEKAGAGGADQ